jgi:NADH dehydrogenase FAD-containing subunit
MQLTVKSLRFQRNYMHMCSHTHEHSPTRAPIPSTQVRVVDEDMPWPAELASMGLASRARLLRGSVQSIDRLNQCLTLSPSGGILPYDLLVR